MQDKIVILDGAIRGSKTLRQRLNTTGSIEEPNESFNKIFSNQKVKTGRRESRAMITFKQTANRIAPATGNYAVAPDGSIRRLDKLKARLDKQLKNK